MEAVVAREGPATVPWAPLEVQEGRRMLTVADCASHRFASTSIDAPRLSDIDASVAQFAGEPFVLTARTTGRSTYVHPGLYETLREILPYGFQDELNGQTMFDALAVGQVAVSQRAPAVSVAKIATAIDLSIVVGVDDYRGAVCVLVPSWLSAVLPSVGVVLDAGIAPTVESLVSAGDLPGALATVEQHVAAFHSEQVNGTAPNPLHCLAGRGHFVARCPCQVHAIAPCERLRT
jgi:hypothetical protein